MGPIEILFLMLILITGGIGIVRGYHRELGVTTMLLLGLLIIQLLQTFAGARLESFYTTVGGGNPAVAEAWIYSFFMLLLAFISYQGETLIFPGSGTSALLGLLIGWINGYLLWGTIWYFLNLANWLFLPINTSNYTQAYQAMVKVLPPAVLPWWFLVGLVTLMLVLRVLK